ncbi:MAG: hypothetical protein GY712_13465, partial [Oceanicoccus sp.]|uniref:hypothetical protein n=1 Tax=Oceanicoccus sp. TaxID=2691044 RepID=UPI0026228E1B
MKKYYRYAIVSGIVYVLGIVILGEQMSLAGGSYSFRDSPLQDIFPDSDVAAILFPMVGMSAQFFGFGLAIINIVLGIRESLEEEKNDAVSTFKVIVDEKIWLGSESTIVREIKWSPQDKVDDVSDDSAEQIIGVVDQVNSG